MAGGRRACSLSSQGSKQLDPKFGTLGTHAPIGLVSIRLVGAFLRLGG